MFSTDDRETRSLPADVVLAPIARRAIGEIIDQLLVLIPVALGAALWGFRPGDELTDGTLFALNLTLAGIELVYATSLIAVFGRTVGKIVSGTRVIRLEGGSVGWISAAQRAVVPVAAVSTPQPQLSVVLVLVVYGLAYLGPFRQGLHDRAAGTIVVMNGSRPPRTA